MCARGAWRSATFFSEAAAARQSLHTRAHTPARAVAGWTTELPPGSTYQVGRAETQYRTLEDGEFHDALSHGADGPALAGGGGGGVEEEGAAAGGGQAPEHLKGMKGLPPKPGARKDKGARGLALVLALAKACCCCWWWVVVARWLAGDERCGRV